MSPFHNCHFYSNAHIGSLLSTCPPAHHLLGCSPTPGLYLTIPPLTCCLLFLHIHLPDCSPRPTLLCALLLPLPPGLQLKIPPAAAPCSSCRQKPNYPTPAHLLSCHDAHLHTFSSVCILEQQYQQFQISTPNHSLWKPS